MRPWPASIFVGIASLVLAQACSASARNLDGLILMHYVAESDRQRAAEADHSSLGNSPSTRAEKLLSQHVETSLNPLLVAQVAITAGRPEEAALALLKATDRDRAIALGLEAEPHDETVCGGTTWASLPAGPAEYRYGLAMGAMQRQSWREALEQFQRAVAFRPGPWPDSFVERYREVLAHAAPYESSRLAAEQSAAPAPAPLVLAGRKDQLGWQTPIPVSERWQLEGFALRGWAGLELGLPVTVDTFWRDTTGGTRRQTQVAWNLLPNGGFELGLDWSPPQLAGWYQEGCCAQRRDLVRSQRKTAVLVSPPSRPGSADCKVSSLVKTRPGTWLMWSAWIDNSHSGNPHIFVSWLDARKNEVLAEIPIQGNANGSGRDYAGMLRVPDDAEFLLITLMNWKSGREVLWDNMLLLEVRPPADEGDARTDRSAR